MLSIQAAGSQILNNNPGKFYIFVGTEYGIKYKYIKHLAEYYGKSTEFDSISDVVNLMKTKHFPPLKPQLYVIRYDESILDLGLTSESISKLPIIGTVVCIYESDKMTKKCDKLFPEHTVTFDPISREYILRYLHSDFPKLPEHILSAIVSDTSDYMSAYLIANLISLIPDERTINGLTANQIRDSFGVSKASVDQKFRYAFASKNFSSCAFILDNYMGSIESLYYVMLSTLLDLEKTVCCKQKSDLSQYAKQWDGQSIYNMFHHVYSELSKSRSLKTYNVYDRLLYLISVLQYSPIPELGA